MYLKLYLQTAEKTYYPNRLRKNSRTYTSSFITYQTHHPLKLKQKSISHCLGSLPMETQEELDSPITLDELQQAVSIAKPGKAPGPDGFTLQYYKNQNYGWDFCKGTRKVIIKKTYKKFIAYKFKNNVKMKFHSHNECRWRKVEEESPFMKEALEPKRSGCPDTFQFTESSSGSFKQCNQQIST